MRRSSLIKKVKNDTLKTRYVLRSRVAKEDLRSPLAIYGRGMASLKTLGKRVSQHELTPNIEELLLQIGRLEERLAALHRHKPLKTLETELHRELEQLRKKLLSIKESDSSNQKIEDSKQRTDTSTKQLEFRERQTAIGDQTPPSEKQEEIRKKVATPVSNQPLGSPSPDSRFQIPPPTPAAAAPTGANGRIRWSVESLASELHPKTNEDAWLMLPEIPAAAVFDGVSAATLAAEASLRAARRVERALRALDSQKLPEDAPNTLGVLLHDANDALWRINQANKSNELASTATVMALTTYREAPAVAYATLGDSRLSIWHASEKRYELAALDDHLLRLLLLPANRRPSWVGPILRDHGLDANLTISAVEMTKLARILDSHPDPATSSPLARALFAERNLVTQSLGLPAITPHIGLISAKSGDRILLATDGIHDNLTEEEITQLLSATPIAETAAALVVRAHEVASSEAPRAKKDDITALVLEVI